MKEREYKVTAKRLAAAWKRYAEFFGEPAHGTEQQLAALLELVISEEVTPAAKPDAPVGPCYGNIQGCECRLIHRWLLKMRLTHTDL